MTAGSVSAPLIIPIIQLQTHRSRNHIDTSTPVSIQSDTPEVLIFFTLDGSKPAAAQPGASGSGRKYIQPILLPPGRVALRAVAVTSDGRESSIVTKVFSVRRVDSGEENFLPKHQQPPSEGPLWPAEDPAGSSLRPAVKSGGGPRPTGESGGVPRFLNSRLGSSHRSRSARSDALQQLTSTQTTRINRETDFLWCAQCLSVRPSDPFARFCAQCGAAVPPLPEHKLPPAEGGQMVCCVFCNARVPVNTPTCLICDASVRQQLQPQSRLTLQDHVVCVSCGSGNPAHISSCLTCESRLQPATLPKHHSYTVADHSGSHGRRSTCSKCKRVNNGDARFCDWCGAKLRPAASCVVCWRCGATGLPHAFYCAACGVFLEAPPPSKSCCDITTPPVGCTIRQVCEQALAKTSHDATWKATPSSGPVPCKVATTTAERYTQTVGLYYPSATELERKEQQRVKEMSRQQATRDRQPLLTSISPGRGYWRKQLDHVCSHLRSYTQNNAAFRALLGEPRLGRMVSAVVEEDLHEVSVRLSFVAAGRERQQVCSQVGLAADGGPESLGSVVERSADGRSHRSSGLKKPKAQTKDLQLLKELGPGQGRISAIHQLLDQGANPSCCSSSDGRHALAVAVLNGHHAVLPVLVQRGADVDQQSGRMKNTALHEAAALSSEGLNCARVLLSCNASVRRRNVSGQTAYDVAVDSECSEMVSLLAARTGPDLLD